MTDRTLLNFELDFRGWCPVEGGWDCLRLTVDDGGDEERGGVNDPSGGVEDGEGTSAHCDVDSVGKYSPLLGNQELLPIVLSLGVVSGGVFAMGLGDGDGAFALIESGCRILKI